MERENLDSVEMPNISSKTRITQFPADVTPCGPNAPAMSTQGQLERIKIPVFAGNKMDFQRWHAVFTSCVDKTSLTPQFKMLRLEAYLDGEAAETIKGLG